METPNIDTVDTLGPERFAPVPDFSGYRASTYGRVQSCLQLEPIGGRAGFRSVMTNFWTDLNLNLDAQGHQYVHLYKDGKRFTKFVHRIILETFVGPRPKGLLCRHFPDRCPQNNRLDNIQWGTMKENKQDEKVHGTCNTGIRNGRATLTDNDIRDIRELAKQGLRAPEIAKQYGVHSASISRYCRGASRGEAAPGENPIKSRSMAGSENGFSKLTENDIPVIRARLAAGHKLADIARDYNVSITVPSRIRCGKTWTHVK